MERLLIIADDFTGALDTGVQFTDRGAETQVVMDPDVDFSTFDDKVKVIVVIFGRKTQLELSFTQVTKE